LIGFRLFFFPCLFHSFFSFLFKRNFEMLFWDFLGLGVGVWLIADYSFLFLFFSPHYLFINHHRAACSGLRRSYFFFLLFFFFSFFPRVSFAFLSFLLAVSSRRFFSGFLLFDRFSILFHPAIRFTPQVLGGGGRSQSNSPIQSQKAGNKKEKKKERRKGSVAGFYGHF